MAKYDVVIIGSGLGGLVCGYILSKEGFNVCVLEKHFQIGGCLQTFKREGCTFDTGVHYVGGMHEGGNLWRYFKYFDLIDNVNIRRLDHDFDVISFHDRDYTFATGADNFVDNLAKDFPEEKENLKCYMNDIKHLTKQFPLYNLSSVKTGFTETAHFSIMAHEFINSRIKNKRLQNVLAGSNMLYAGVAEKTPAYIHALINYANIESSWRFVDGSQQIANSLAASIRKHGGEVLTRKEVVHFHINSSGEIFSAELDDGDQIQAKSYISAIHPALTLGMIDERKVRTAYRDRILALENTISTFILYVVLKKDSFPYLNYNVYFHGEEDVWTAGSYRIKEWPGSYMLITPATSRSTEYADCVSLICVMSWEDVKKWHNTSVGNRGEDYEEFKKMHAEKLLDMVEIRFPGFRKHVKSYYSSTPLTYRDYTGTKEGAIYGIQKDSNNILQTIVLPKTKIPNLFLAGQNTNIHGVLGVTIGSILACGQYMDMNYIVEKIKAAT